MVAAIILAAGGSTRMGEPKALLPDADGRPFVARIVRTFAAAGVDDIVVVTGAVHDAIVEAVTRDRPPVMPRFVENPDPSRGQLSSLWAGLAAVDRPGVEAALMTLVDVPMLETSTIVAVVDAWRRTHAPIVRPAIGDRHGHPVLFDRRVFDELRRAPLEHGAKVVVHEHADRLINVEVSDTRCLIDVDTPAEYNALVRGAECERE
jgi:molybdenum cofactor cytidylyltransferase